MTGLHYWRGNSHSYWLYVLLNKNVGGTTYYAQVTGSNIVAGEELRPHHNNPNL